MNNLVDAIVNGDDGLKISGRRLYSFLEIKTQYSLWFKRMCKYGFVENSDFITVDLEKETTQGNSTIYRDHIMAIDMAKEIAMIQRNENGKKIRLSLIEAEKENNDPENVMARALLIASSKVNSYKGLIQEQYSNFLKEED